MSDSSNTMPAETLSLNRTSPAAAMKSGTSVSSYEDLGDGVSDTKSRTAEEVTGQPASEAGNNDDNASVDEDSKPLEVDEINYRVEAAQIQGKLSKELRFDAEAEPLHERRKLATLRHNQSLSYATLLEHRVLDLENRLDDMGVTMAKAGKDTASQAPWPGELPPPMPPLEASKHDVELSVAWLKATEFCAFQSYPYVRYRIIDVLTEPLGPLLVVDCEAPVSVARQKWPDKAISDVWPTGNDRTVERIRIRSSLIIEAIGKIIGQENAPSTTQMHIRPFKVLLACEPQLRELCKETKEKVSRAKRNTLTSNGGQNETASEESATGSALEQLVASVQDDEGLVEHLEFLFAFMDEHLKDSQARFKRPRSLNTEDGSQKRSFAELWPLFLPGDLVFDPKEQQAYRVLSATGGRPLRRHKFYDACMPDTLQPFPADPPKANIFNQLETNENVVTTLFINCFYLDFDGIQVGPVQRVFEIDPFEGTKDVSSLVVYPVEYSGLGNRSLQPKLDASGPESERAVLDYLRTRGQKFAELPTTSGYSHQNYRGYSLGKVREWIDADVILDPELYYQLHPMEPRPILGIEQPAEADVHETQQTIPAKCCCGRTACLLNSHLDLFLYDDRKIDQFLIAQYFTQAGAPFVRFKNSQDELKRKHRELFPRRIEGFVLRERAWHTLNIERLSPIKRHERAFEEKLIVPPEHKRMIESLVKTHPVASRMSDGEDAANTDAGIDPDLSEDIVRGKGRGRVILLHGEPGVGKTSTAECVAEATGRPLFALTCGDLGHTASDVQLALSVNFRLAHRWGCVMLLDEADVFLQTRDRWDIQRNAIVSVFLRTLEYYNGILFLTTNKIGLIDEAFKSRCHLSLYYQELDREAAIKIWKLNLDLIEARQIEFDRKEIVKWAKKYFDQVKKESKKGMTRPLNGRQIHNACQTAAAMAVLFDQNVMKIEHLAAVAKSIKEFDVYLATVHAHSDVAQRDGHRADHMYKMMEKRRRASEEVKTPTPKSTKLSKKSSSKKKKKNDTDSDSESETDNDAGKESERSTSDSGTDDSEDDD